MDNSIEIDASPVMHDNNWIGVVCCAIFHTGNGSEREMSYPRTKYFCPENPPIELRSDVVIDHSDHMWLFYFSRQQFNEQCELNFIIPNVKIFQVEVRKYGYRFVYEQDLQLLNLAIVHAGNLTALKRKFSAIEENM